jgi:hypothetical protein
VSTILITRQPTSTETITYSTASNARLRVLHLRDFVFSNGDYNADTRVLTVNSADGRQITFQRETYSGEACQRLAVCHILFAGGVFPSVDAAKAATFGEWTPSGDYVSRSFYFTKAEEGFKVVLTDFV